MTLPQKWYFVPDFIFCGDPHPKKVFSFWYETVKLGQKIDRVELAIKYIGNAGDHPVLLPVRSKMLPYSFLKLPSEEEIKEYPNLLLRFWDDRNKRYPFCEEAEKHKEEALAKAIKLIDDYFAI